jgi:sulfate permease, SulP family
VVDSMSKASRVDNDQELVGQGMANMASAFFGGIPVTGVIARSATNIQAGARTRLASILHAMLILAVILWLSTLGTLIPKAALAGILAAVALRMVETHVLVKLWRGSRAEAIVFVITAGAIVVTDLIDGVQVGLLATVFYFVYEMSSLSVKHTPLSPLPEQAPGGEAGVNGERCQLVMVMEVEGPLFFASSYHLRQVLNRLEGYRCVVLDMAGMPFLDVTGTEVLEEGVLLLKKKGSDVVLACPTDSVRERLQNLGRSQFHALLECPVYDDLRDAMLHATRLVEPDHLCGLCRAEGECKALNRALKAAVPSFAGAEPRVRALVAAENAPDQDEKVARGLDG